MSRHALNFRTSCAKCGGVHAAARGDDADPRQIVADLTSDDRSPFVPDDLNGLMSLTPEALLALRDKFLGAPSDDDEADPEKDDPAVRAMLAHRSPTQRHVDALTLKAAAFRANASPYRGATAASDAEIEAMTAGSEVVLQARRRPKS